MSEKDTSTSASKHVPHWVRNELERTFTIPAEELLGRRTPARGGLDAWQWVENGHTWTEVIESYDIPLGEFRG